VIGWVYWATIFFTFWNFVSWLFLIGLFISVPTLFASKDEREFWHRVKVSGWLVGLILLLTWPNFTLMPEQVYRHFHPSESVLTPNNSLVIQLRNEFYAEVGLNIFEEMSFWDQMYAVDKFIYRTIEWKSDMEQYGMVGLLTTPEETISRRAGDCQGQAVTTASLLLSMHIEAWVVETPFHWWTHARDNRTGMEVSLNVHGNGGSDGTVLPQPIDLVYTRWPPRCSNCSALEMFNQQDILYAAPPWRAFATAYVGMHMFVREWLPAYVNGNQYKVILWGAAFGVLMAVYASLCYESPSHLEKRTAAGGPIKSIEHFIIRLKFGLFFGIVNFVGIYLWANWHYQYCMIHFVVMISCSIAFLTSEFFNSHIGAAVPRVPIDTHTPTLLQQHAFH